MRSVKLLCALLVMMLLLCLPAAYAEPESPAAESGGSEPVVRVGMYIRTHADTRRLSSVLTCDAGFEIGRSDGTNFLPMITVSSKRIVIVPLLNMQIDYGDEYAGAALGEGNFGAWSVKNGLYGGYYSARAAGDFAAVTSKGFESRFGGFSTEEEARAHDAGRGISSPAGDRMALIDADTQKMILTYEDRTKPLALRGAGGALVSLPMVSFSGSWYIFEYPGFFEFEANGGLLNMVNCVGLEEYTRCVMANEIGGDFTKETRRAFSILARTFALGKKHGRQGYDVCSRPDCCQCYYGVYRMGEENNEIVDSTRGLACFYKDEPIAVLYTGANGGASCSSVAAWGGDEVPYLTTVFLENDEIEESARWETTFTRRELYEHLSQRSVFSALSDMDISMRVLARDPYGSSYITTLSVSDGAGHVVEINNSENVRMATGFSSANFDIEYTQDLEVLTADGKVETRRVYGVLTAEGYKPFTGFDESYGGGEYGAAVAPDKVTVRGVGSGHGVGFSATGSEKLSLEGYDFRYILQFYFKGTEIKRLYQ